jgi:cytoskeleton protein RodZ
VGQLGEELKKAREELGFSLDEVAAQLNIKAEFLEALEAEAYDQLPARVVARGFLRNYASFLGFSPEDALAAYSQSIEPDFSNGRHFSPNGIEYKNIPINPAPMLSIDLIISLLLIIAVIGGVGYFVYDRYLGPLAAEMLQVTPVATGASGGGPLLLPTPTPLPTFTPQPTPTPTPQYYTGVTVELNLKDNSWIQILVDGNKVFEGVMNKGEKHSWSGLQQVAIRAGNAGSVEVTVNGQSKGLMGEVGQVVDQVWEKAQ